MTAGTSDFSIRPNGLVIRPMTPTDVAVAEEISGTAFLEADRRNTRAGDEPPTGRTPAQSTRFRERAEHFLRTDPGGCWVAELGDVPVGVAVSLRRDLLWILATLAVHPGTQGHEVGRALLDAALQHSRGCLRGLLESSPDHRAFRLYREAGFSLHPLITFRGCVDATAAPPDLSVVRAGTTSDFDWMDSIDRARREAAHGADHQVLIRHARLLTMRNHLGEGYVYVDGAGSPLLLAATSRRIASTLLWAALMSGPAPAPVSFGNVSAANEWAVDVALAAQLRPGTDGFLGVRGMKPPTPYLTHGAFL